ncbi:phosphoribosylglycinamide formyltransferase [Teredinibacter turnerae]|uniref:Phosphoribosylglycinamide formyltransferase n=1 Tax=Teredinibacter turnerae (strain ATCC 39867 / T7901) TaxID=377629 RepID=C5BP02_TERTT|nr:phosphoribosylglycinamide formyltransferase [Teredinibacter turnerae]ACR10680.1 phosphoribosylglycinamide formyltransferase [Teredinibacter turnerae T7901]
MKSKTTSQCRLVVLISGSGSNLQAIIDAQSAGQLPIEICAVISNREGVLGLERAAQAGIATRVLNHKSYESREAFDGALSAQIDAFEPDLVVLAGFMRILTAEFTNHYLGKMINIHPSLLPKYQGLHTHQRALEAGDAEHGVSVHFVTAELDGGPVISQARVPVLSSDTADTLAARVLEQEHLLYPRVIGWFAQGRLSMKDGKAFLDGEVVDLGEQ